MASTTHLRRLALPLAAALALITPAAASAAEPVWLEQQRIEVAQTAIYGVSCASVVRCVGAAGAGPVIQDRDVAFRPAEDPNPDHISSDVSCAPGTAFCMLVDDAGGALTLTGETFGPRVVVAGTQELQAVSCPTATFCAAIDRQQRVYRWSGGAWSGGTTLVTPGTKHPFNQLACASPTSCVAVVSQDTDDTYGTVAFRWNGTAWSLPSAPFNTSTVTSAYPTDITCPSASLCLVAHEEGHVSRFDGSTWTTQAERVDSFNDHPRPFVSCAGTTCMLVDHFDNWRRSTDGGQTWSPMKNFKSDGSAGAISAIKTLHCPTATLCVAADGLGNATTFAEPPAPTAPSIAGEARVGQALTLTGATVQTPGAWRTDRWFRCDAPGSACDREPISTSTTGYTLTPGDAGFHVEARETIGFGFFSTLEATTNAIGPVCDDTCTPGGGSGGGGGGGGGAGTTTTPPTTTEPPTTTPPVTTTPPPVTGGTTTTTTGGDGGGGGTTVEAPLPAVLTLGLLAQRPNRLLVAFRLSAPAATVSITVERRTTGRRKGRSCVARTRRNARARACTRHVRLGAQLVPGLTGGPSTVTLAGVGGRRFTGGTLRVTVQALDARGRGVAPLVRSARLKR